MKYIFTAINMLLIACIAYLCVGLMYKTVMPEGLMLSPEKSFESSSAIENPRQKNLNTNRLKYDFIVRRNIFKAEIDKHQSASEDNHPTDRENMEKTTLKLVLWGTVTGAKQVWAVIEDKKLRKQGLYEAGDSVQGAKIKKIFRHEVILNYQGADQVLEMSADVKNSLASNSRSKKKKVPVETQKTDEPADGGSDLNSLIKQVRMRPRFSGGEPDGLMLYGIRPSSVFNQVGLKNGDIIRDINGTAILSAEDAPNLFKEIKEATDAKITIVRRGEEKELEFQVKDGKYSVTSIE